MEQVKNEDHDDLCDIFCYDEVKVNSLRDKIPLATGLGTLFKALSDETRAKIVYCLLHDELCVCDIASVMQMSVQAVSHHLRLLRTMRLVKNRRDGKMVFYTLDDDHVGHLLEEGLAHVHEIHHDGEKGYME